MSINVKSFTVKYLRLICLDCDDHGRIGKSGSGPDWPAELYHLQNDPAQKRNRYNRQNEAGAKRLHQAHLEILRNAHTPEEKLRLRLKLPDFQPSG